MTRKSIPHASKYKKADGTFDVPAIKATAADAFSNFENGHDTIKDFTQHRDAKGHKVLTLTVDDKGADGE